MLNAAESLARPFTSALACQANLLAARLAVGLEWCQRVMPVAPLVSRAASARLWGNARPNGRRELGAAAALRPG